MWIFSKRKQVEELSRENSELKASLKSALKEVDHFRNELNSYINGWHPLWCGYPEVGKIILLSRGREEKSCVPGYYNGKSFCIWLESERGFVNTGDVYAWQNFPKPVEPGKMR